MNKREFEAIIGGGKQSIKSNLDALDSLFFKIKGKKACRTCPAGLNYLVLTLKHYFKMTRFKFKTSAERYKINKKDKFTIHNGNLTDELAIKFIRARKSRAELFIEKPKNWEKLVDGYEETKEDIEASLEIEAEMQAAKEGKSSGDSAEIEALKSEIENLQEKVAKLTTELKETKETNSKLEKEKQSRGKTTKQPKKEPETSKEKNEALEVSEASEVGEIEKEALEAAKAASSKK